MKHYALTVLIVAVAAIHSCEAAASGTRCGPNETFKTCGSACPPICNDPGDRACTLQCVVGCQCSSGFNLYNGSCVDSSECPKSEEKE